MNETATYPDDKILTVEEAAKYLRISTSTAYKLTQLAEHCPDRLPCLRVGRIVRIPFWGLKQYVARQANAPWMLPPATNTR